MIDAQRVWIDSPAYLVIYTYNHETVIEEFNNAAAALAFIKDEVVKYDGAVKLDHFVLWQGRRLELFAREKITVVDAREKGKENASQD